MQGKNTKNPASHNKINHRITQPKKIATNSKKKGDSNHIENLQIPTTNSAPTIEFNKAPNAHSRKIVLKALFSTELSQYNTKYNALKEEKNQFTTQYNNKKIKKQTPTHINKHGRKSSREENSRSEGFSHKKKKKKNKNWNNPKTAYRIP